MSDAESESTKSAYSAESSAMDEEEPEVEEPPKIEEPKVEEPEVEEPKVEEPKVEKPKVEKPKVEEPKVGQKVLKELIEIPMQKPIGKRKVKQRKVSIRKPFEPVREKKKIIPRYFCNDIKVRKVTEETIFDLDKEKSPFRPPSEHASPYQKDMLRQTQKKIQKKEGKPLPKKAKKKSTLNKNLRNRLYVKMAPDTVRTITDYDKTYNIIVQGRPICDVFSIQEYVRTIRDVLKTKIILGYREDDIMLLNKNEENEQRAIRKISKNLNNYSNMFDDLLAKDHMLAAQTLKKQEEVEKRLFEVNQQFTNTRKMYNAIKARLYKSEEKWNECKKFQKFLIYLSPLPWKKAHADQIKDFDLSKELTAEEEERMFSDTSNDRKEKSLEVIIEGIHRDFKDSVPPQLYFKESKELLEIFNYIELQNMENLLHSSALAEPLGQFKNYMDNVATSFDTQINRMNSQINELANAIEWEENRVDELEKMTMSLIYKEYKEMIMSEDILNLYVYVEDVYESAVGQNDDHWSVTEMMHSIEKTYRKYLLVVDKIPQERIHTLERHCFNEQMAMMKRGEIAVKQYAQLETLIKQVTTAFAPPFQKSRGKEPKRRSKTAIPPKPKPPPPRKYSFREEVYLEFFTDFCEYTDDGNEYMAKRPDHMKNLKTS